MNGRPKQYQVFRKRHLSDIIRAEEERAEHAERGTSYGKV
jgi:hypothetical protein